MDKDIYICGENAVILAGGYVYMQKGKYKNVGRMYHMLFLVILQLLFEDTLDLSCADANCAAENS